MTNGTELAPFIFPETGQPVRAGLLNDEPWFVAPDACAILGLTNVSKAVAGLDEDEKKTIYRGSSEALTFADPFSDLRIQSLILVSEPGLYSLVMRSKVEGAKRFRRWVTHEVLPAIRKHGSYSLAPQFQLPQTFADALRLAADQQDEIERLKLRNEQLTVKAESFDAWIDGDAVYLVGTVAKMLKIGPKALWDFLYEERILINAPKTKRHREPYAGKPSEKWFKVEPVDPKNANGQKVQTTYVLPFGAEQLRLLLIRRGVLPSERLALLPGL